MSKEKFKCTKELLEKAKNGDKEAIALIYENTKDIAYKKAYSILKNHHDAEDIAEDTFVKTLEKIDTIKKPNEFTSWISKVAENKAKDLIKKSKPTYMGEDFEYTTDDPNSDQSALPENVAESNENIDLYKQLISKLTDNQRTALVLNRIEGRTFKEIAEMLGCSESTVKSRVRLGEDKLKKEAEKLKKKGYTLNGMMPLDFFTYMSNALGVTSSNISVILGSATTKSLSLKAMVSIVTAILIAFSGLLSTNFLYGTPEPKQNGLTKPTTTFSSTIETTALKSSSQKETTVIKTTATDEQQTTIPKKVVPQTVPITMATKNYQVITKVPSTTPKKNNDPETNFSKAFSAYKNVLRKYAFAIKDYNKQVNGDNLRQISFVDILGDDTPELLFVTKDDNENAAIPVSLSIYTYDNGECKKLSCNALYFYQSEEKMGKNLCILYQKANEKNLYIFTCDYNGNEGTLQRLSTSYDNKNRIKYKTLIYKDAITQYEIDSKDVDKAKYEKFKRNSLEKIDKLLLYSNKNYENYSKYCNPTKCIGISYNKAIKYINHYNKINEDFSKIAGTYNSKNNKKFANIIRIDGSGAFRSDVYYNTEQKNLYYRCKCLVENYKKENDNKYTFYLKNITILNGGRIETDNKSRGVFNSKNKVVFYAKGTLPSEMDKNDCKVYKSFFDDNDSPIKYSIIILRNKSRNMCEVYIKEN